jgi:hypothetical protein
MENKEFCSLFPEFRYEVFDEKIEKPLAPVWMYELGLGIANLEFGGPNSAVWMVMEFKFGNWPKFQAKSTMCYFGLLNFRAAPL